MFLGMEFRMNLWQKIIWSQSLEQQYYPVGFLLIIICLFWLLVHDGLISYDSIVEIKCSSSIKDYTPEEAFHEKK